MEQEAANNLPLGLLHSLTATPQHFPETPFMATADADGAVVAAFLQTPPYNLIIASESPLASLPLVAGTLHQANTDLPGVAGPADLCHEFGRIWTGLTGSRAKVSRSLRIFADQQVRPPAGVAGGLRRATRNDRPALIDWFTAFAVEANTEAEPEQIAHGVDIRLDGDQTGLWWWEVNGEPVTLVGANGLTPNGIRIGPVYTPPTHRRRGYASAATAEVSQRLLDSGRSFVFLFTDRTNTTAEHIYQTIGYESVGDVIHLSFVR
jgi:predicted GNAT family acetyltransferase